MPRRYPVEFRRKVLDLVEAGKPVAEIADQLGVSDQTIYTWRKQDRIDRGLRSGVTTSESAELTAARKRIRELETELAVTRRANELLKERVGPKRRWEVVARIVSEDLPVEVACRVVGVSVSGFYTWRKRKPLAPGGASRDARRGDPRGARRLAADLRRPPGARRAGARPQR